MRTLTPEDIKRENAYRTAQRKAGKSRRGNIKDPNAPKKPLSAYFMFLQRIRSDPELVKEVFGDETETTKQSVLAAGKWRSMTDDERKVRYALWSLISAFVDACFSLSLHRLSRRSSSTRLRASCTRRAPPGMVTASTSASCPAAPSTSCPSLGLVPNALSSRRSVPRVRATGSTPTPRIPLLHHGVVERLGSSSASCYLGLWFLPNDPPMNDLLLLCFSRYRCTGLSWAFRRDLDSSLTSSSMRSVTVTGTVLCLQFCLQCSRPIRTFNLHCCIPPTTPPCCIVS